MADLQRVLAALDGVQEHDGYYSAHCPGTTHRRGDRRRSLSITPMPDGSVRLKCFAGCAYDDIIGAGNLDRAWLRGDGQPIPFVPRAARPTAPPQPKPAGPKRVKRLGETWYAVRDLDGAVQAWHKRVDWQLEDGSTDKDVSWWQPDRRTPGLGGRPLSSLPLYGTERLSSLPPGSTVVLMEGEKAADAFNAELQHVTNVIALGTVTGAGDTPSRDVLAVLSGYDVVLWPDADEPGRDHMERCAATLADLGAAPRWFTWRHAGRGDDAADYLARPGADPALLVGLLDNAPAWTPPAPSTAPSTERPRGTCPACSRDRRNVIELAQFKGAVMRAVRNKKMKPAERLILIEEAFGIERHQRATGTDGPAYRPHTAVAASLGISRGTVKEARERWAADGAIIITQGPPPADLVERRKAKEYDGTCVAPAPPADERDAALTLAARTINTVISRVEPKPHGNLGRSRQAKVASVLPEQFKACEVCPPTTPVIVEIKCAGADCGRQSLYEGRALTTPASQTVPEIPALVSSEHPDISSEETVPENAARFVTATPVQDVLRRRRQVRDITAAIPPPPARPRCQATGCRDFAAEASDYCSGCQEWGWGQEAAAAPPPPEPPPVPPAGDDASTCRLCDRLATHRNPEGLHCYHHALDMTGSAAFPLRSLGAVGDD